MSGREVPKALELAMRQWMPPAPFEVHLQLSDGVAYPMMLTNEGRSVESGKWVFKAYGPAGMAVPMPLMLDVSAVPDYAEVTLGVACTPGGAHFFSHAMSTCN